MGRGNDAIPTWSGFNYQGKMMLLYVLELINQIAKDKNKDIGTYSVELEKTEDFCIICNSEYRSFHQVKAYLSKDKWNSYSEAMDKLLKHRAESNNPAAKCYLTVAREIKDWDDASNTYNVSVELYKRASKIVGVCDVRNEINTEILEYLRSKGYSDKTEEVVYGELCLFLDDSIARMHKQDSKKRKYIIKFSDIVGVMESAIDKEDVRKEYFLKEKIYEYVMQNIEKALNNLCQDECDTSLENCNRVCAAKCGYEKMTGIVDYGRFCKLLNPSKVDEWDNELNLVENLSVDKIQSEIYELLYRSGTPEKVIGDNCGIYLQSKYSQAPSKQVIPTFLDLTRGARKERALQNIFQNIINNTDIIDILAGNSIIKEFYNAAESGKFDKNKCPLCGTNFSDINSAIIETEQFIKNIHTDGIKIIEEIETQIINLFQKEIIPVLKVFLEENKILIKIDDTLSGCKALSVERLQQLLYRVKILEFKSQGIEKFDIEEFSQQYENLLKELQEKEVPNKIIFQEKQVELYKSIHRTYYHNEKPYHTVGELQSKEQYVAKLFNDSLSLQLSTEETQLRKLKRDCEEYKKKTEDMTDAIKILISKYEDANKEYQTQLLNAIKIPLMVYSGRIIQNYPLGLGIRAIIKTNQLVFEAASKSGSDVYNILSTGQLNGLSIALLLSIKNVYGDTKGLDILLIDDPLQTIDDISAISLADLLTQQGIGQIVLSTHEETKAALLRYKFKHAGMSVREQNMQALYMKTVTEE